MDNSEKKSAQKATVWQKIKQPFIDAFGNIFGKDELAQLRDTLERVPQYKRLKAYEKSKYRPSRIEFLNYLHGGLRMSSWGRAYHEYLALRKFGKIDKDWEAVVAYFQGDKYKKPLTLKQIYAKEADRKAAAVVLAIKVAQMPIKQEAPKKITTQPSAYVRQIWQNTR